MMKEKRFELWKVNDNKNGVKDNLLNAYYVDDEIVNLLNAISQDKENLRIRNNEKDKELLMVKKYLRRIIDEKKVEDDFGKDQERKADKIPCP